MGDPIANPFNVDSFPSGVQMNASGNTIAFASTRYEKDGLPDTGAVEVWRFEGW